MHKVQKSMEQKASSFKRSNRWQDWQKRKKDTADIKSIIKEHYKQLYTHKFYDLDEMD